MWNVKVTASLFKASLKKKEKKKKKNITEEISAKISD